MQFNWFGILLIFFLILLNAFFAASEIAVISISKMRIQQLKEKGNKSADILLRLIQDPSLFLATIQVGITLAGFLASATAAVGLSKILAQYFQELGIAVSFANTLGVFIVTLIISYLTLILGELAPKRIAMQWSESIALKVAQPINFLARMTAPITRFLTFSTNLVVRILGGKTKQEEREITENEIRLYIREHRNLPLEEKQMIEGVFNFGDQVVRQLMVPRMEIMYIHTNEKVKDALDKVCNSSFSNFPVYLKNYDDVVGIINIHDLACQVLKDPELIVKELISPAFFVPETKHTVDLLKDFRRQKVEIAIVVDEYGGVAGLVTLEDLVDEIIGDIIEDQKFFSKISEGKWLVKGDVPIIEVIDKFKLKKLKPKNDYETLAGFILEQLGHLPKEGESISWEGYRFQVQEMDLRRIQTLLVTKNK